MRTPVSNTVLDLVPYTVTEAGCFEAHRTIAKKYGFFPKGGRPESLKSHSEYAHRAVLEEKEGRLLSSTELACHTCDNTFCINPAHLYKGTKSSNMKDALERHPTFKASLRKSDQQKQKLAEATKQRFATMSEEDKAKWAANAKVYSKKGWEQRTPEQREAHRKACQESKQRRVA